MKVAPRDAGPRLSLLGGRRLAWIPATALSIASACQPADRAQGEVAVSPALRGDTLHVHSRAPIHRDTATLREVARIGVAEGAEQEMLNDVSAFVELPGGTIVVADDAGLRAFSAAGEYLDLVARRGEGPGEVEHVVGLAATPSASTPDGESSPSWASAHGFAATVRALPLRHQGAQPRFH